MTPAPSKSVSIMALFALTASSLLQKLTKPQFLLRALSSSVLGHMILIEYTLPKGENASWPNIGSKGRKRGGDEVGKKTEEKHHAAPRPQKGFVA